MKLMGDDDDRLAIGAHIAHDREELVRLLRRQDSGGFVEDQHVRAAVKYLDDLDGLFLGDRHLIDLLVRVDLEAVTVRDLRYCLADGGTVQLALVPLQTEDDVFSCGKDVDQLEMLVDHTDALVEGVFWRPDGHGLAVHEDLALVGVVDSTKHVHQRGFSAAVLTEQRENFALAKR